MEQGVSPNKVKAIRFTLISLGIQFVIALIVAGMEDGASSGPLGGIFIFMLIVLALVSLTIHGLMFLAGFRRNPFLWMPLLFTFLFWCVVVFLPFAADWINGLSYKVKKQTGRSTYHDPAAKHFKNQTEPLLREIYQKVKWREDLGVFEVQHLGEAFYIGYTNSDPSSMEPVLYQKLDRVVNEADTAYWIDKAKLIRPLMGQGDQFLLDSVISTKAIQINFIVKQWQEHPTEINVEYVCGKRLLTQSYNASDQAYQLRMYMYAPAAVEDLEK